MPRSFYPKIGIRSKCELAKRLSDKKFSYKKALILINDVCQNFDQYWNDYVEISDPKKNKYVRNTAWSPLGKFLKLIDSKILEPHDKQLPNFIFGGVSGKNHIQAVSWLVGTRKRRSLYKMDLKSFFEQIKYERIVSLFHKKCNCGFEISTLLAKLCCTPLGSKGTEGTQSVLARGFPTSPRLSVWCNLNTFLKINQKVKNMLTGHDYRLAIYIDDIGIMASKVSDEKLISVGKAIQSILDKNGLYLNKDKTFIMNRDVSNKEHLGIRTGRRLGLSGKTRSKLSSVKNRLKGALSEYDRHRLKKTLKGLHAYKKQVKSTNSIRKHSS